MSNSTIPSIKLKVGLIGAGLQGKRRSPVLKQLPGNELVMVASKNIEDAKIAKVLIAKDRPLAGSN